MKTQVIEISKKTSLLLRKVESVFYLILFLLSFSLYKAEDTGISSVINETVGRHAMYIAEGTTVFVSEAATITDKPVKTSDSVKQIAAKVSLKRHLKLKTEVAEKIIATNNPKFPDDQVAKLENAPENDKSFFTNVLSSKVVATQITSFDHFMALVPHAISIPTIIFLHTLLFSYSSRAHSANNRRFGFQRPPPYTFI